MPSATDDLIDKEEIVIVDVEEPTAGEVLVLDIEPHAEVYHETAGFAKTLLLKCIRYIVSLLACLGRLWINNYPRIFGVVMLPSPLKFIIIGLVGFAGMKSQGYDFPFKTHPRSMNVAIASLIFYGLASAAEHVISTTRLGPTSVYAIVAHSGRIGCFCILVVTVASLFYL